MSKKKPEDKQPDSHVNNGESTQPTPNRLTNKDIEDAQSGLKQEAQLQEETAETALKATDELAEQAREIEKLKEEIKQLQDKLLRQAADFQNYRRRMEEELRKATERGKDEVIKSFLHFADDLHRAVEAATKAKESGSGEQAFTELLKGIQMVYENFLKELERLGVKPFESVGQPFDENHHEAMMQQEAPEGTPSGTVIAEIQRGYKKGDQVLRHAKVIVSK